MQIFVIRRSTFDKFIQQLCILQSGKKNPINSDYGTNFASSQTVGKDTLQSPTSTSAVGHTLQL